MRSIVAICGPTASGKSSLAIRLCKEFDGEVVSFDSMQIYRGFDVGTAKPSPSETAGVPHHLIDICDPSEKFSAADFIAAADAAVEGIVARGKTAVLCGGTGLYLDSFVSRRDYGELSQDDALRASLAEIAAKQGNAALHAILERLDPDAARAIHQNNVKRVVRAIEICKLTGMTKTEWDKRAESVAPDREVDTIILDFRDRDILYNRINARVDEMISHGLVEEVKRLYSQRFLDPSTTASQAIGYKEMIPFIKGEIGFDQAVENLKLATRHYAKRQLTWFKKSAGTRFFVDDYVSSDELAAAVIGFLKGGAT